MKKLSVKQTAPFSGDKRLDEWVPASRVTTLLSAPSLGTDLNSYSLLSTPSLAS